MATVVPAKETDTYAFIPPPPLPEFYSDAKTNEEEAKPSTEVVVVKKKTRVKTKSASKQSALQQVLPYLPNAGVAGGELVVSEKFPATPGDATDERMIQTKVVRTTSRPLAAQDDVPPLACYHICRICLRPRSQRYHREHPIVINGAIPPPGICRRCRVAPVEEIKTCAEVVKAGESNPVRIGVSSFVPEEDIVSNREMREMRGRRLLRSISQRRLREDGGSSDTGETREIRYRHVKIRERTRSPQPKPAVVVSQTPQDAIERATSSRKEVRITSAAPAKKPCPRSDEWPAAVGAGITQPPPVLKNDHPRSTTFAAATSSVSPSRSKVHAAAAVTIPAKPERTEAEIRKIAREEVERYRAAERKLEAHPDPYAHGRMIPIERRIEQVTDKPEPVPWDRKVEKVNVVFSRKAESDEARQSPTRQQFEDSSALSRRLSGASNSVRSDSTRKSSQPEASVERKIEIERVSQPGSRKGGSSYTSGSGWVSKPPGKSSDPPPKTNIAEPRSTRSEIRKWDLISDLPKDRAQDDASASQKPYHDHRPMVYRGQGIWMPRPPPPSGYDVVEVSQSTGCNSAPSSRPQFDLYDRIQELQDGSDRMKKPQQSSVHSRDRAASDRSKRTDREYRYDDDVVRTESQRSSRRKEESISYRMSEPRNEGAQERPSMSEPNSHKSRSDAGHGSPSSTPKDQDVQSNQGRPRAFDLRWAAAMNRQSASRASVKPEQPDEKQEEEDRRSQSTKTKAPPSYSSVHKGPASDPPEQEYIYTERIVRPVRESQMCRDGLHRFYSEEGEFQHSSKSSKAASASEQPSSRSQRKEHREQRIHVEAKKGDSEHSSARVRFASKIEISPTPPGSDASSQQFRDVGGRARSRRPLDGERPEDLIEEYERRGRARSRNAHDRALAQEDHDSQYERTRAEYWGADGASEHSRRSERVSQASRSSKSKHLDQALSESPSRELSPDKIDGHGPYHPEQPREASMDTQKSSGHGGSRGSAWNDGYANDYAAGSARGFANTYPDAYAEGCPDGFAEGRRDRELDEAGW